MKKKGDYYDDYDDGELRLAMHIILYYRYVIIIYFVVAATC
jgi:hypothetical protein